MKRLAVFLTALFTIFALNGCNAIDSAEETSDEAYICIGAETARTIMPSFNREIEKMDTFSLYGKKTAYDTEIYLGGFSTYEGLLAGRVSITTGTWHEFTLTGRYGWSEFIGTIQDKEIVQGRNSLNFTLTPKESQSLGWGNIDVTFKIPSSTAVKAAKAYLYYRESDEPYIALPITVEGNSVTAKSNVWQGTYRLKAWFYADEECTLLVSTFNELVKVVGGGTTSKAEREIEKLNAVYTITLKDAQFIEGYTPKTLYTRYAGLDLPTADKMHKDGYIFMGWYTTDDEDAELFTETPANTGKNVTVYAKWIRGCSVTAGNCSYINFSSEEYGDAYTIKLQGPWNEEALKNFSSQFKSIPSNKAITLDMSETKGVTSIGTNVFRGCSSLAKITIPESVTSIEEFAFEDCSSLAEINIPEGVTSIGMDVFRDCSSLAKITIPKGVTRIGNYAFWGCSSLAEITIPKGVTSIGKFAFWGCHSLTEINIPQSVTSIGNYTFSGCRSLAEINIPEGVTSIGGYAFRGCRSLAEINIPGGVTSIGGGAFRGCYSLTEITIPEGVTRIAGDTFSSCISLTEITIPESVTSIEEFAFDNCNRLRYAFFRDTESTWYYHYDSSQNKILGKMTDPTKNASWLTTLTSTRLFKQ